MTPEDMVVNESFDISWDSAQTNYMNLYQQGGTDLQKGCGAIKFNYSGIMCGTFLLELPWAALFISLLTPQILIFPLTYPQVDR